MTLKLDAIFPETAEFQYLRSMAVFPVTWYAFDSNHAEHVQFVVRYGNDIPGISWSERFQSLSDDERLKAASALQDAIRTEIWQNSLTKCPDHHLKPDKEWVCDVCGKTMDSRRACVMLGKVYPQYKHATDPFQDVFVEIVHRRKECIERCTERRWYGITWEQLPLRSEHTMMSVFLSCGREAKSIYEEIHRRIWMPCYEEARFLLELAIFDGVHNPLDDNCFDFDHLAKILLKYPLYALK